MWALKNRRTLCSLSTSLATPLPGFLGCYCPLSLPQPLPLLQAIIAICLSTNYWNCRVTPCSSSFIVLLQADSTFVPIIAHCLSLAVCCPSVNPIFCCSCEEGAAQCSIHDHYITVPQTWVLSWPQLLSVWSSQTHKVSGK